MIYIAPEHDVTVYEIPEKMSLLLLDLNLFSKFEHQDVTITGWQGEDYRKGGAHDQGRALDIRTYDLRDGGDKLCKFLKERGYPYLLEKDHIHIQTDGVC